MTRPPIFYKTPDRAPKADTILRFIGAFVREQNAAPTIREIMDGLGISSTSVVFYHLRSLQRRGLITQGGRARSIRLVSHDDHCPFCGRGGTETLQ